MPRGWRHWELVVRALERLNCVVYDSDDYAVWISRANVYRRMIRKWWIPVTLERHVVASLRLDWDDYLRALADSA